MSTGLIALITSPDAATRDRSLDDLCTAATFAQLLAECDALDAFRRESRNLYERVRALFRARIPGGSRDLILGVRPGDIAPHDEGLGAEVYVSELLGESTIVNLKIGGDLVKMRVNGGSPFRDGEQIRVRFDPNRLHLFERDSGKRIEIEADSRMMRSMP